MHFFELRNIQHFVLYIFPTLIFIIVFGVGLKNLYFRGQNPEEKMNKIVHAYPGGIEERNAPFPLVLILIIAGTVIWGLLYIILYGVLEVKI